MYTKINLKIFFIKIKYKIDNKIKKFLFIDYKKYNKLS